MQTLRDLFERNARCFPDREAFVCDGRRLTHAQYAARARRLASALHELGVRRQERVAILATNCIEYYEAYAAADFGATILATLNFRLAPAELLQSLRDCGARALIFEPRYDEVVATLRPQLPEILHYIRMGEAAAGALSYEDLLSNGDENGPPVRPAASDYSLIWYTSGTTGKPKGVPWRHHALLESARTTARVSELSRSSRFLQTTPAFHIPASIKRGADRIAGNRHPSPCR